MEFFGYRCTIHHWRFNPSGLYAIGGEFSGQVQIGNTSIQAEVQDPNSTAGFIALVDSSGNLLWAKGTKYFRIKSVTSSKDLIAVTGSSSAPSNYFLDGQEVSANPIALVAAVRLNGQISWLTSVASDYTAKGVKAAIDVNSNEVLVIGNFYGNLCFPDPISSCFAGIQPGTGSGFVAKIDSLGIFKWAFPINANEIIFKDVKIDGESNVLIAGGFYRFLEIAGQEVTSNITSNRGFLFKISENGEIMSLKFIQAESENSTSIINSINVNEGTVYVLGSTKNSNTFEGHQINAGSKGRNFFLFELDQNLEVVSLLKSTPIENPEAGSADGRLLTHFRDYIQVTGICINNSLIHQMLIEGGHYERSYTARLKKHRVTSSEPSIMRFNNEIVLEVFPNPSINTLNAIINTPRPEALDFIITDFNGRTVLSKKIPEFEENHVIRINHSFPSGTYFIEVTASNNKRFRAKMVVGK